MKVGFSIRYKFLAVAVMLLVVLHRLLPVHGDHGDSKRQVHFGVSITIATGWRAWLRACKISCKSRPIRCRWSPTCSSSKTERVKCSRGRCRRGLRDRLAGQDST